MASLWLGANLCGTGTSVTGPGTLYQSQTLKFLGRAYTGDKVVAGQGAGKLRIRGAVQDLG
jgi:hypothetical protein